jgi:hypothetical protein
VVSLQVGLDLGLCSVSVGQELLLVIQQLLPRLGGELGVLGWASELIIDSPGPFAERVVQRQRPMLTLNNRVDGAGLLAETAVDALCHVDIVSGCSPRSVLSGLRLDRDSLGGADGLAQLARWGR